MRTKVTSPGPSVNLSDEMSGTSSQTKSAWTLAFGDLRREMPGWLKDGTSSAAFLMVVTLVGSALMNTISADLQIAPTGTKVMAMLIGLFHDVITELLAVIVLLRLSQPEGRKRSALALISPYTLRLISEWLRMMAVVILYGLFLILPGLYQLMRLMFVTLIVIDDPRYLKGDIDALAESRRLTKKHQIGASLVTLTLLIFSLANWYLATWAWGEGKFALSLTINFLGLAANLIASGWLLFVARRLRAEAESHI